MENAQGCTSSMTTAIAATTAWQKKWQESFHLSMPSVCPPMASAMRLRILSISERPTDFSEAVPEGSLISWETGCNTNGNSNSYYVAIHKTFICCSETLRMLSAVHVYSHLSHWAHGVLDQPVNSVLLSYIAKGVFHTLTAHCVHVLALTTCLAQAHPRMSCLPLVIQTFLEVSATSFSLSPHSAACPAVVLLSLWEQQKRTTHEVP